jgi:hypothetical protein
LLFTGFEIRIDGPDGNETKMITYGEYLDYMAKDKAWGDGVMLSAAAHYYGRRIIVISAGNTVHNSIDVVRKDPSHVTKCPIYLGWVSSGGGVGDSTEKDHYVSLVAMTDSEQILSQNDSSAASTPVSQSADTSTSSVNAPPSTPVFQSVDTSVDTSRNTSPQWPDVWSEQQWLSFKRKYCWLDCLEGNLGKH